MAGNCLKEMCYPDETGCNFEGEVYVKNCPHYKSNGTPENPKQDQDGEEKYASLPWTGSTFGLNDLNLLTATTKVYTFGITGASNAGKTTFLATLYCLLRNGFTIGNYKFAGSYTMTGWENVAWYLSWDKDNEIMYPPHTSINSGRVPGLLHISIRSNSDGKLHHLIFTDAPGEWFENWAYNKSEKNSEGAEWVYRNSDALLLFADCEKLSSKEKGKARHQISMLSDRLLSELEERPLALIWSKSDNKVSSSIENQITNHMKRKNPAFLNEFRTSVKEAGDYKFHSNILESISWCVDILDELGNPEINISTQYSDDYFLLKSKI